jgi:hypothetical protein
MEDARLVAEMKDRSVPVALVYRMLLVSALILMLGGCARIERDPLSAYQVDPDAFGIPITTFAVVSF